MSKVLRKPSQRELEVLQSISGVFKEFREELKGYKVLLFGSRVQGVSRERSDFDIAIDGGRALDSTIFFKIHERLRNLPILHSIDFVDLASTDDHFRAIALQHSKVLLSA